jgi:hypothetical protein
MGTVPSRPPPREIKKAAGLVFFYLSSKNPRHEETVSLNFLDPETGYRGG